MQQEKPAKIGDVFQQLTIGVPTEKQLHENRLCLTPKSVEVLVSNGHKVIVESGAGIASGYSDHEYSECGAIISTSEKQIFESNIFKSRSVTQKSCLNFSFILA